MDPRLSSRRARFTLLATLLALAATSVLAAPPKPPGKGRATYAGVRDPEQQRSLFEAWKAQHRRAASAAAPALNGGTLTPIVGRASMVINNAGTVLYTKDFLGTSCDVDFANGSVWRAGVAHAVGDFVAQTTNFSGNQFMATNAGTTGAAEPAWPVAFGATVVDGTITWVNSGTTWLASTAYTAGMVARPTSPGVYRVGFLYQAMNSGTTAATPPAWPTTIGGTIVDGGVTWKAIGYYPGSFVGCNAMQMVERASGGAETAIAQEGDLVGQSQLSGWGEFVAMNATGKAAFRAELAGFIRNDDESSAAILTAGPGAGALTALARNGDTFGTRFGCGFSTMVAINDAGQVVFDAYAPEHEPNWTPTTAFTSGNRVYATSGSKLLFFTANNNGTSGASEPTWPTTPGQTVVDGGVTWTTAVADCDENDHALVRFTTGPGNQVLIAQGSTIGTPSATVIGFGQDDDTQAVGNCGGSCNYQNFDGFINSGGHVPVVLNLSDGTQGVFIMTAPGTATQAVRLPAGNIAPRTSINNSDQVVYKGTTGGLDRIFRFTPPSTTVTIASVGDVVNGHTISSLGTFTDINNSGNVVFQASFAGDTQDGFYYWDGAVTEITTAAVGTLASEMITINDANQVAYVTGASVAPSPPGEDASEEHEDGGIFFWTKAAGSTKAIQVGDGINGDAVTTIYAQHTSFARRQFSPAGCLATLYHVLGDDPDLDCNEGNVTRNGNNCASFAKGGQLFIVCAAGACPTITLAPPTLPGGTQGSPYNQTITASGGQTPYTFAVTVGSLPPGLTLTAGGVLSGTPTSAGSFPFTVTATDANACTGSQAYTLVIGSPTQVTIALSPPSRTIFVGNTGQYTATINIAQATDTVVTLSSANPAIATVPATVTILAGQTSAIFLATGVAPGGPITITATLPASFGAPPATALVTVVPQPAPGTGIPMLSPWALAIFGLALAAAGILLMKTR